MTDDDWVLLSEIEHWSYCPRQWAIIHLEQRFDDDERTTRGHLAHARVDRAGHERRGTEVTWWAVDVWSDALRIRGRCDRLIVVDEGPVVPVEHKSGRRAMRAAEVQLAGQALCLEDMLGVDIAVGRLYLVASNETVDVAIAEELRSEVTTTAEQLRAWRRDRGARMPAPANDQRCPGCSLQDACQREVVGAPHRVRGFHGATWWP